MNETLEGFHFVISILIILGITLVAHIFFRLCLYLYRKRKKSLWVVSLVRALRKPCLFLIWMYGIYWALEMIPNFTEYTKNTLTDHVFIQIRSIVIIVSLTWFFLAWKKEAETSLEEHEISKKQKDLIYALSRVGSVMIVILCFLLVLSVLDVPLQALLTFGGVGGLALSLAAKDVVGNFFGGLMIHLHRPFGIGEWIRSPNQNFEGIVEEIGWYNTKIRTLDRRPMYIPNGLVTDAIIENPGRMYNRRIKADITLRYKDIALVEPIIKEVKGMLLAHPDIAQNQQLLVNFVEYASSSLNINMSCFTKTIVLEEFLEVQQDVFLKVADIVQRNGADFAFSTQTIEFDPPLTRSVK